MCDDGTEKSDLTHVWTEERLMDEAEDKKIDCDLKWLRELSVEQEVI